MAGHLLGITANETVALMGDIEAFAEIGDYIDQPMRTYSSGMQVRLAFSIATAVRPEILIVDEALSVGDTYFQHKSFARIREFRECGTTLLFVSHSPGAVKTLCDRAILLDHGILVRDDTPDAVLDYYNALIATQRAEHEIRQSVMLSGRTTTRSGSAEAVILSIDLFVGGQSVRAVHSGDAVIIRVTIESRAVLAELTAGILIRDRLGNDIFGVNTYHLNASRNGIVAGERLIADFAFPALALGVGSYSLTAALHARDSHVVANYDWWDRALVFQVMRGHGPVSIGVCALDVSASWRGGDETGISLEQNAV
jgi:lipopolysaccharide transport system ATP-binding protein